MYTACGRADVNVSGNHKVTGNAVTSIRSPQIIVSKNEAAENPLPHFTERMKSKKTKNIQ